MSRLILSRRQWGQDRGEVGEGPVVAYFLRQNSGEDHANDEGDDHRERHDARLQEANAFDRLEPQGHAIDQHQHCATEAEDVDL